MRKVASCLFLSTLCVASAAPITITISFTGNGSVGGIPFTGQQVTITATGDTSNINANFGASNPAIQPFSSFTIAVNGFTTGNATNLANIDIGNAEGNPGFTHLDVNTLTYMDLGSTSLNSWNLQSSIGPINIPGTSGSSSFVELNNGDVWGTTGIPTSAGNIEITLASNVTVTAVVAPAATPTSTPAPPSWLLVIVGLAIFALVSKFELARRPLR